MVSLLCTGFRPATCALGGACHMIPALLLPELAATAAKKSSSSSFILIILVIGVAAYFLLIRPNQQKAKKAKAPVRPSPRATRSSPLVASSAGWLSMEGDKVTIITGETTTAGSPTCSPPARDAAPGDRPQGRADRACRRGRRPRVRRPRRQTGTTGTSTTRPPGTGRTTTRRALRPAGRPAERHRTSDATDKRKRTAPRPARKTGQVSAASSRKGADASGR